MSRPRDVHAGAAVGEILVRSPSLMDGSYGDPQASAVAIDWLRTGDLGYLSDGELFVTGRVKDLIIKGGHNLLPAPIEEIAGAVEGVRAGCVVAVGVPSQRRATELVYVVAETKAAEAQHAQLARRVRDALLARGIAVDRVELVAPGSIPRTTSGKVRRREVAGTLAERRRPGDPPPVLLELVRAWRRFTPIARKVWLTEPPHTGWHDHERRAAVPTRRRPRRSRRVPPARPR